ncbi:hypothetical protein M8J77_009569 [Diaphorina citri]|nr:hypothetical protein M8J77_009569 [Diaphorina citri]
MSFKSYLEEIDADLLICLVKLKHELWDKTCDEYKDRQRKTKAWQEICEVINPAFKELDENSKQVFAKAVVQKWTNLRDCWFRAFRNDQFSLSGAGGKKISKPYVYKEQMGFLRKVATINGTNGTNESTSKRPYTEGEEREEETVEAPQSAVKSSKKKYNLEESMVMFLLQSRMNSPPEPESPMLSFFKGVLPSVASFDNDQVLEFQSGVLALISKIKKQT